MPQISVERLNTELFEEILPLARKCWHESTVTKAETCAFYGERDFDIEPDIEEYQRRADLGALLIVTLRDDSQLVGYVTGILYRSMHHKKVTCALGDNIYIEPEYRSHARTLIARFEQELTTAGAEIIGWPTSLSGSVYQLLKARGYIGDDIIMEKRLCASSLQ